MAEDGDEALDLLAQMAQATDVNLARLARALAGRLVLDITRSGQARTRGIGKLIRAPMSLSSSDIDIDASLDSLTTAQAEGRPPALEELTGTAWRKPGTAICLLVDRSGSMNGKRLACAALAAAVCSWRAPTEFAVLAFGNKVLAIKELHQTKSAETVVDQLFTLRGHGTTDIDLALRAANSQLMRSTATRKLTLLLSDAEATTGADPIPAARQLPELAVLAPEDEPEHAQRLTAASGARLETVADPLSVLGVLKRLVD